MKEWIGILIAFVHNDQSYDFGTRAIDEMKVMTSDDRIEIQKDERFKRLVRLSNVFASGD